MNSRLNAVPVTTNASFATEVQDRLGYDSDCRNVG
jgi:hypothetical protein